MVHRQLNSLTFVTTASELAAWTLRRRRRVRVVGDSMLPTLRGGEFVLIDRDRTAEIGDVVVAAHPTTGLVIIKRIAPGPNDTPGLWLLSDNLTEGSDSRSFGPINSDSVVGVVTLVLNRPAKSLASTGAIGLGS